MSDRVIIHRFAMLGDREFYTCRLCKHRTLFDFTGDRRTPYTVYIPCFNCGKLIWKILVVPTWSEVEIAIDKDKFNAE